MKITKDGLLSLAYSVSGGAYSYLIQNQSILASNGPLPASFRVGFAASDGGASNVHEIMCFKATSDRASGSSASVNEKEVAKVDGTAQAYFAFYDPNNWTGTVTANTLTNNNGVVSVSTVANWDASCVLTGTLTGVPAAGGGCATTGAAGPTNPTPAPTSRVMLTWDTVNNIGIPFEWTSLNGAQQAMLNFGDATPTALRLNYLRGDRSNEINSQGIGLYRDRDAVLGDIVDSSPAWVGPPSSPYTQIWQDRLYPGTPMPENSGTQSYLQFVSAEQTRLNVVYVGANDGFLHGFRTGSFDVNGNFVANATTPNDGQEVLAYMPGTVLASAATPTAVGACTSNATTQTIVQNIHGVTPAVGANRRMHRAVPSISPIPSTAITSSSMRRRPRATCSSAPMAHLARRRTGRRRPSDVRARHHGPQQLQREHAPTSSSASGIPRRSAARTPPAAPMAAPIAATISATPSGRRDPAAARRQLGRHFRQRIRQLVGRCGHLRDDDRHQLGSADRSII